MKGARIVVEIPTTDEEDVDRIFEAVADAAHDAQPEDRDWDVFIYGVSNTELEGWDEEESL